MAGWQDDPIATAPAAGGWAKDPIAGAAPPPSAGDAAFASGRDSGQKQNGILSGLDQAARQYLPGSSYIGAGARYALQRAIGVKNPDSFDTDLAFSRGQSQGEAEGSQTAATIGGVAGGIGQAVALGGAITKAAEAVPVVGKVAGVVLGRKGETIKNLAKGAALGGEISGGESAARGDDAPTVATNSILGAGAGAAGTAVGSGLGFAYDRLAPTAAAAWRNFARIIGENPKTLEKAIDTHVMTTGSMPSTAQITSYSAQNKLRQLAAMNDTVKSAAVTASRAANAPFDKQVADAAQQEALIKDYRQNPANSLHPFNTPVGGVAGVAPQSADALTDFRDAYTNNFMSQPTAHGVPLRDAPVNDTSGLFHDARIEYALRPDTDFNARTSTTSPSPLLQRLQNNSATLSDLDQARQAVRGVQDRMASNTGAANETVKGLGDVANKLEGLGKRTDKNYGVMLDNYRGLSHYRDAFEQGLRGEAADGVSKPMAQAGYNHGAAVKAGKDALNFIAGASAPQTNSAADVGMQMAQMAKSGGLSLVSKVIKAIPGIGHLPQIQQDIIAKQLFDPATTVQGVNNLRRARASLTDMQQIAATIGGAAGARMTQALSPAPQGQ